MFDLGALYIVMLEIEQRNLSRYSNVHNFSHGCPIWGHYISWRSKLNNGTSRDIQMVLPFHTDVRFRRIIYWDARNITTEPFEKFNWSYLLECTILGHNISRRSKLYNETSWEIEMVITFHTDVRFGVIIQCDARNRTTEAVEKFKWSYLLKRMFD